jgi:hypothetical protein
MVRLDEEYAAENRPLSRLAVHIIGGLAAQTVASGT